MSLLFLSHSSRNNAEAVALHDWLGREGWDDVFLDVDIQHGIAAGERWEQALNQAAERCEAVLFLVSHAWLASEWCLREFNLAFKLNKRLFGILIEDIPSGELPVHLTSTWQLVRLSAGQERERFEVAMPVTGEAAEVSFSVEGLARLRAGLRRAGLDPTAFAWPPAHDPERSPYPGLKPLEPEDAGIYFGREAPTAEALARLQALGERPAPRLFCVVGASGSGKSSFLRAGLWPRLQRDDRHMLPLPVLRPERAAITGRSGLLSVLDSACRERGLRIARADIELAIEGGARTLRTLLGRLVDDAVSGLVEADEGVARPPLLVLPIDQAEELFGANAGSEATALLSLLRDLTSEDAPALALLLTIRSDAIEQLQLSPAFEGVGVQTMTLSPLPRGIYATVIEGPVARMAAADRELAVDPALTRALLADLEDGSARDALPLLAFTLERLWLHEGRSGRLTLAGYEALGRVRGSIEAAVERALVAADRDPRAPAERGARLHLLRRGLVPWLAGIDPETGAPRRRVAHRAEVPPESLPLIDLLVEERLLSADTDPATGEATLEPAHEALLRQWGLLQGWLEEDLAALAALEGVRRATRDWDANARDPAWLAHGGSRLGDAEAIVARADLAAQLGAPEREYLRACRARADREIAHAKERARQRRWLQWGSVAAALVFGLLGIIAIVQWQSASRHSALATAEARRANERTAEAERERAEAERQRSRAEQTLADAKTAADGLIFDLAQGLRGRGLPITVVRDVLSRAETLMARLVNGSPDDAGLLRSRAAMLTEFADTYESVGDTDRQGAAADGAVAIFRRLLARNPSDLEAARDLSIALNRASEVLASRGDLKSAIGVAEEALTIMRRVFRAAPDRRQNAFDLLSSLYKGGKTLFAGGEPARALLLLEEGLALSRQWSAAEPHELGFVRDLSVFLGKIADIRVATSDLPGALRYYREALGLTERLAAADPTNAELARNLSLGHTSIGDVLAAQGDGAGALAAYREGLDIIRRLSTADPANARFARDLSVSLDRVAGILEARRDLAGALAHFEESLSIRQRLATANPSNAGLQRDLSIVLIRIGDIRAATRNLAGAKIAYGTALAVRRRLHEAAPDRQEPARDLVFAVLRLGEFLLRQGDLTDALPIFEQGLPAARGWVAAAPSSLDAPRTLSLLLFRVGQVRAEAGDLERAFAAFDESLSSLPKDAGRSSGAPSVEAEAIATSLGDLAYKALVARNFKLALRSSERGIAAAPALLWIRINRAHALMFLGRRDDATAAYREHRGKQAQGDQLWEALVIADFAEFRRVGITDGLMNEVEALLSGHAER